MVSGSARRAGTAGDGFPRWKIREAVKLGRELGAKAVEVDGIKFFFPHPASSAQLPAGDGTGTSNAVPASTALPSRRRGHAGTGAGAANVPAHGSVFTRLGARRQGGPHLSSVDGVGS
jgi:hypothetical protein